MAFGRNVKAYIGFAKETTWGSAVTPTIFVPVTATDLSYAKGMIFSGAALGNRDERNYTSGLVDPASGGWSGEIWQDEFGYILGMILGSGSDSTSGSGTITHTLTPQDTLASWTVEKGLDVAHYRYTGWVANELTVNIPGPGEVPNYTITGFSKAEATTTSLTPSFPTANIFAGKDFKLYYDDAGTADPSTEFKCNSVSFTISNGVSADDLVPLGYDELQSQPPEGTLTITGTLDFTALDDTSGENLDLYDVFRAGTTKALRIEGTGTSPYKLTFDFYEIVFTGTSPNASGREGEIPLTLEFRALYNTSQSEIFKATVISTTSAAYA